jgi:phosphopentomutase
MQRLHLMNNILEKVIEGLPEDALLVLMGDHGMTLEGEHGKWRR